MKFIFTSLLSILLISSQAQTIPNASFESWMTGAGANPDLPAGWKTNSIFPGFHKVTDAHSGAYALKMSVAQYFTGEGAGDVNFGFGVPPTAASPSYYTFWAKVHLSGTDKFNVTSDFTMPPSSYLITDIPYGRNSLSSADNTTSWRQFSFALETSTPMTYDTIGLRFTFSPALDTSSYVIVDDLAFSSYPAGLAEAEHDGVIEAAYPNPVANVETIVYSLRETADVSLDVYDILGQKVTSVMHDLQSGGKYKTDIDVSAYPAGIYYAYLAVNGKSYVNKLIVQH